MHITELRIRNVRCLENLNLSPGPGINLLLGDNGSGKTSLLESIYLLSRARSFRPTPNQRLVRNGTTGLDVFARLQLSPTDGFSLGVERSQDALRFKHSRQPEARLIDMVRALPLQVITPDIHNLLERGPTQRRRFLDWGVFHVEPQFFPLWQRYRRALRQRNASLRQGATPAQIQAWDAELVHTANEINRMRRTHTEALRAALAADSILARPAPDTLDYYQGWPADSELQELLGKQMARDRQQGYTSYGPHRADMRIRWEGRQAQEVASRGEQKFLVIGLLLLQAQLLAGQGGRTPIILLDDMAAELGEGYRARLMSWLDSADMQVFASFLTKDQLPAALGPATMFHVKQGSVSPVAAA